MPSSSSSSGEVPNYPPRVCYDPRAVVWPANNPQDEWSNEDNTEQLHHKSHHAITGVILGFHEPEQYGLGWVRIKPSVPWVLPGSTEEPKTDENGDPILDEEDEPIMQRVVYAVPKIYGEESIHQWRRGSVVNLIPYPHSSRTFNAVAFTHSLTEGEHWTGMRNHQHVDSLSSKSLFPKQEWFFSTVIDGDFDYIDDPAFGDFRELRYHLTQTTTDDTKIDPANIYAGFVTNTSFLMRFDGVDTQEKPFQRFVLLDWNVSDDKTAQDFAGAAVKPTSWQSTPVSLTPVYMCEVIAGSWTRPTPVHWSFTEVLPLPGHVNAANLPVGWIEFPRPMSLHDRLFVKPGDAVRKLPYTVGLWAFGKPFSVEPNGEEEEVDRTTAHVYPMPFSHHDGRCTGMLVGLPPGVYGTNDEPLLYVRDFFGLEEIPPATPAADWEDPDAPPEP